MVFGTGGCSGFWVFDVCLCLLLLETGLGFGCFSYVFRVFCLFEVLGFGIYALMFWRFD